MPAGAFCTLSDRFPRTLPKSRNTLTRGGALSHRLDVHVLDSDGDPVTGTQVEVVIEGIWKGGSIRERTDDDGHAAFETAADYEPSRKLMIYVRRQKFGPYGIDVGAYTVHLE